MSELTQKLEELRQFKELLKHPGWEKYQEYMSSQRTMREGLIISHPKETTSEERTYLAGEIQGLRIGRDWINTLIAGLEEEVIYLKQQEQEKADASGERNTSRNPDESDPDAAGFDPNAEPRDASP